MYMFEDIGQCKWRYAIVDGIKTDIVDAEKGVHGICPLCGCELTPRKGEIRNCHWAHVSGHSCDAWYEPKGEWHRAWQGCFDKDWQEVARSKEMQGSLEKHIADVFTPNGWTIEFQYSHLGSEKIKCREEFYGCMVWVVSGCRLDRDKAIGEMVAGLPKFTCQNGMVYSVYAGEIRGNSPWFYSDKEVFFDYEGDFNCPCLDGVLYCLLSGNVGGCRIWVQISKSDFINAFRSGNEKLAIERFEACKDDWLSRLEDQERRREDEAEKQVELAKQEENQRRESAWQEELKNPVEYAITLGWLQASCWIDGGIQDRSIESGVDDSLPMSGKIAIHYCNEYTKEDYDNDIAYVKHLYEIYRPLKSWPQYGHLEKRKGCIVAKACFKKVRSVDGKAWIVRLSNFERLRDYSGNFRVLHKVADGEGIWKLSGELLTAVNDRKYKEAPNPPRGSAQNTKSTVGELSGFRYTGKGNLYRDVKTGWLHILKNGSMIPLKKENQNWDTTYDSYFHRSKYRRW